MTDILLVVCIGLLVCLVVLAIVMLVRRPADHSASIQSVLSGLEKAIDRVERAVRDEVSTNREESAAAARASREELGRAIENVRTVVASQLEQIGRESSESAKAQREETGLALSRFNDGIVTTIGEIGRLQQAQLEVFSQRLDKLTESHDQRLTALRETIEQRLGVLQDEVSKRLEQNGQTSIENSQKAREELAEALKSFTGTVTQTLDAFGASQRLQLTNVVEHLSKLAETTEKKLDAQRTATDERLAKIQADGATNAKALRDEVGTAMKGVNDSVLKGMSGISEAQQKQMDSFGQKLGALRLAVEERLKNIQDDNAKQLEAMRQTVDEKLQGTLEKRLGESFAQVGERLEQVYKGLGEMQGLASGVGDLKKVLSNVKARGTWGEVQLGALLEQVLTADQYAADVPTTGGSERVEFAIKLPGRTDGDDPVWLPINAKFPLEDYQRLVDAQERADADAVALAERELEHRVKACAKDISTKYLSPPKTTDFGILFVPVEGLFAEVVRRPALTDAIQRQHRVIVAGPSTLWSLLSSLQMGFRTLAIQKRSSEVWNVLATVKTEWSKYADVLAKVQKKLQEASNTVEDANRRTRVLGRKLKDVEALPATTASSLLLLDVDEEERSEVEESVT